MTVCIINFGCAITNIWAPDKNGQQDDIVLGYDNVAGTLHDFHILRALYFYPKSLSSTDSVIVPLSFMSH